jgi:hypothetical protein
VCRVIDRVGGVWQVTYSEAADLPEALGPLFLKHRRSQPVWEALGTAEAGVPEQEQEHLPNNWIRRIPPQDAVAIDSDLVVMLDAEVVRLSGIGPAIWEATASAVPLDELTERVGEVHGRPEDYRAAVAAATGQLVARLVLEQGD